MELLQVTTPLQDHLAAWCTSLAAHPDRDFANYVLDGFQYGFRIGFDRSTSLTSVRRNLPSASEHPEVIDQYLAKEVPAGRIIGPIKPYTIPHLHVSRVGVIPKGHTPGKWRLITDLSFPEGMSVNDGIDSQLCSMQYTSVERMAKTAQQLGRGALMAKIDIRSAYRLVPVHPDDRPLLGIEWQGNHYIDGMLPFGLRSAPKIFTAVADALEWCFRERGVTEVDHYLDDFITIGPPSKPTCQANLQIILDTSERLGVPLAAEKLEGPTSCLTFLGIEIDTWAGILRLPAAKLERLQSTLQLWENRRSCHRRELESLVGLLQHACRVIRPGRSFLRQMIDLLKRPCKGFHRIRLNCYFRADL